MKPDEYILQEYLRIKPIVDVFERIMGRVDYVSRVNYAGHTIRGSNEKFSEIRILDLEDFIRDNVDWFKRQVKYLRKLQPELLAPYDNDEIVTIYNTWSESFYHAAWIEPTSEKIKKAVEFYENKNTNRQAS